MAALVREIRAPRHTVEPPVALISGGECTVTVTRRRRPRRALRRVPAVAGHREPAAVWAIAADTDGIDGSEDNAGAILTPDSMAARPGTRKALLAKHDSYGFFTRAGRPDRDRTDAHQRQRLPRDRHPLEGEIESGRDQSPVGFRTNGSIIARWKPSSMPPNSSPRKDCSTTPRSVGYIAHVAVPCRDLEETARWYAEVLGAQPVRILKDRVTFSFGGVLQLVCHLERRSGVENPRAYPRHHGLTFLRMEEFNRLRDHVVRLGVKFLHVPRCASRTPTTSIRR